MNHRRFTTAIVVPGLAALTFGSAIAKPPQGGQRRGPPPQAIEACESKSAGDACSFEGRNEVVEGTCYSPDEQRPLACRPTQGPGR